MLHGCRESLREHEELEELETLLYSGM
jgi:hypothetical protein